MRVIRTSLYFNNVEAERHRESDDYNVDFAWFNVGNANLNHLEFVRPIIPDAHNQVRRFIDIVVQGSERRNFERRMAGRIVNRAIVDDIFQLLHHHRTITSRGNSVWVSSPWRVGRHNRDNDWTRGCGRELSPYVRDGAIRNRCCWICNRSIERFTGGTSEGS
jgi:hypothetical protein